MESLQNMLERIAGKVEVLGERLKEEQRKCAALEQDNQLLRDELQQRQRQWNQETAQMRGMLEQWHQVNPRLAEEFKMEIDRHISRIDNCIKWLEQQ